MYANKGVIEPNWVVSDWFQHGPLASFLYRTEPIKTEGLGPLSHAPHGPLTRPFLGQPNKY